jgi:hypothetical protein
MRAIIPVFILRVGKLSQIFLRFVLHFGEERLKPYPKIHPLTASEKMPNQAFPTV